MPHFARNQKRYVRGYNFVITKQYNSFIFLYCFFIQSIICFKATTLISQAKSKLQSALFFFSLVIFSPFREENYNTQGSNNFSICRLKNRRYFSRLNTLCDYSLLKSLLLQCIIQLVIVIDGPSFGIED